MTNLSSLFPNIGSKLPLHKAESDAHADSTISAPVGIDLSDDLSAGSIALTAGASRREQKLDLVAASTLTITGITGLSYGEYVRLWLKSSSSVTLTLPAGWDTSISGALSMTEWRMFEIVADPESGIQMLDGPEVS